MVGNCRVLFAVVLAVAIAACGLDLIGDEPSALPVEDAGVVERDVIVDEPQPNLDAGAGIDAADADAGPAGCVVLIEDDFTTVSPAWDRLGAARFGTGRVDLAQTPDGKAASIWWKTPLTFSGHLHIEADIEITSTVPGAGMTIAWVETTTGYRLGSVGLGMALCGVTPNPMFGTAVALVTATQKLSLLSSINGNCGTDAEGDLVTDVRSVRSVVVDIHQDRLSALLDRNDAGVTRLRTNKPTGYFGFTAATGASWDAVHSVRRVKVTSCP